MKYKVYGYNKCSTCQMALKYLEQNKIAYDNHPIVDTPPSMAELMQMLAALKANGKTFKNLFNTSGEVYREQKVGDKIKAGLTESDALKLLAANGKLIKRPFLLSSTGGLVGFKEHEWSEFLNL